MVILKSFQNIPWSGLLLALLHSVGQQLGHHEVSLAGTVVSAMQSFQRQLHGGQKTAARKSLILLEKLFKTLLLIG